MKIVQREPGKDFPGELAKAPDFELKDTHGLVVRLSDYYQKKNVVLVLTRGFV
jgi:peroxiredoxin